MDYSSDELRQRQRKLIYHFGEQVYDLYKSGQVDFTFSSQNSGSQKEITQLLKLLRYMEERILKFEELAAREAGAPVVGPVAGAESSPSGEKTEPLAEIQTEEASPVVVEEKAEVASDPVIENTAEIAADEGAILAEPTAEETPEAKVPAEEVSFSEASGGVSSEEEQSLASEELSEPLPAVKPMETKAAEAGESETSAKPNEAETLETVYQSVEEAPVEEASTATITFQDIRASAQFKSETEKSLFEDNFDMLQTGDEPARARSLKNLSYLGGKEAFQNVCRLSMKDPSAEIRMAALKAAGRTRQLENAELYRAGLKDEDSGVRIASIKGLSMLLLHDSTTSLLPLLRDPDAHVRSIAATCLGIYGGAQGVQAASELSSDQDAYVRKSLVDMLAVVRAPGSLAVVKQLLDDQDEGVRQAAKNALNKVKSVETKGK